MTQEFYLTVYHCNGYSNCVNMQQILGACATSTDQFLNALPHESRTTQDTGDRTELWRCAGGN